MTTPGYTTEFFYQPLDASGSPVAAREVALKREGETALDVQVDMGRSTLTRGDGGLPIQRPYPRSRGVATFGLSLVADGSLQQTALATKAALGIRCAIVMKVFGEAGVEIADPVTVIVFVSEWSSNPRTGDTHLIDVGFEVDPPEAPFVYSPPRQFELSAGDTVTVYLDDVFAGETVLSYATAESTPPRASASATANYTASTKSMVITADASAKGLTTIPVTATDTASRTFTYNFKVNVT